MDCSHSICCILLLVVLRVRLVVHRLMVARRADVVVLSRARRSSAVVEVHGICITSDGPFTAEAGASPPVHDLSETIIILPRRSCPG